MGSVASTSVREIDGIDGRVETIGGDGSRIIRCFGEFDAGNCEELAGALENARSGAATEVLVDLSGTEFLDCRALSLIVSALHRLRESGGTPRLAVGGGQPGRLLGLTQIGETIETVGAGESRDVAQAGRVAPFSGGAPAP